MKKRPSWVGAKGRGTYPLGGWVQCDSPFASTNWIRFDGCNLSESFVKVLLHPVSLVAEGISL
ncbi:hypothetical protein AKJ26_00455 [Corynebacterium glutamicum]|nr:hypothetical protein AKJ26_00455 [Corynebacterium glutamicum]TWS58818.1 hypothetical protein AKJ27_01275 [Corynebacterium glutamicum]